MILAKDNEIQKSPPRAIKSLQLSLFQKTVSNDPSQVSNTIEVWDGIPKYFFTPGQMKKLRTEKGHADPFQWDYLFEGISFKVKIQPALIEQKDGTYKAFFPSVTEELVEEALKKIFMDQTSSIHIPEESESWVRFTLRMVFKELKERGRERNISQIKQAVEIMSSCIITLYKDKNEVYRGPILGDLITVGRKDYLADANSQHIARLPVFISNAINALQYRQINYGRLMECNSQLTRWLYKLLVNKFRHASVMNDYHFSFVNCQQASGLLQQGTNQRNREKMVSALDELITNEIISKYNERQKYDGRKIIDTIYTVHPTSKFITDQKAANKRFTDGQKDADFIEQQRLRRLI